MYKIRFSIIVTFFFVGSWFGFMSSTLGQSKFYTKRVSNELRKGPANYYPLIGIVPQNTQLTGLKEEGQWLQIRLEDDLKEQLQTHLSAAWISKNCLIDKPMEQKNRQLKITTKVGTPSSVAAAIRGFAIRFKRTSIQNIDALLEKDRPCFTNEEYHVFVKESGLKQKVLSDRTLREKYDDIFSEYDVSFNESIIGFNIAAEIASRGIVDNLPLQKYLNLLGTVILQRSNAYDHFFRIYILDSSKPEAYSTSSDIIFISLGMIRACTSEAELGAIIAHEINHVILQHGIKEIQKRSHKIRAEEGFAELDKATGNVADSTETELEEYMQEAYDSVVKPRLLTYEEEADRGAIVFLVQTGYDPNAVVRIINRIPTLVPKQENDLEENPFMRRDYEQRSKSAASFIDEYFPSTQGVINIDRFEKYCLTKEK
jgi:hypothetical protein